MGPEDMQKTQKARANARWLSIMPLEAPLELRQQPGFAVLYAPKWASHNRDAAPSRPAAPVEGKGGGGSTGLECGEDKGGRPPTARLLTPIHELELELILSQMAQKPMLRGEVGARALRVRSDVRGHG